MGCDGVEDNKTSPQNRECAFTEISTRGDFYAFSMLTYAFQNLKRRSRPIVSDDFCRSPSFADPPRWADKKNRSAHIGADRIQVSLLFALRIPRIVLQEWLRNRSSRPLRLLRRDIAAARSFLRSSRP